LERNLRRPPSLADKYFQEELETEEWDRQVPSSYPVRVQQSRMGSTDADRQQRPRRLAG